MKGAPARGEHPCVLQHALGDGREVESSPVFPPIHRQPLLVAKNLFLDSYAAIPRKEGKLQPLRDPQSSGIQPGYNLLVFSFGLFSEVKSLPKAISRPSEGFPRLSPEKDLGAVELL